MKRLSYNQLEQSYQVSSRNLTANQIALNDILRGEIVWAAGKRYTVGLTRLDSACGGLVVLRYHPGTQPEHTVVYYFCDWSGDLRRQTMTDEIHEIMELRLKAMAVWGEANQKSA